MTASPVATEVYAFGDRSPYFRKPTPVATTIPQHTTPPVSPAFRDSWLGVCSWVKTYCVEGPAGTGGPNVVAIDNKIEQAMDLVKTHLMYAVREEVELLRTKISELETKVLYLERENSVLREHVPPEILAKLMPPQGTPTLMPPPPQPQITAGGQQGGLSQQGQPPSTHSTLTNTSSTQVGQQQPGSH